MKLTFNMIGIFVNDLSKMVDFYCNVIGLKTNWDGQSPFVEFEHDNVRFTLFARSELPTLLGQVTSYVKGLNGSFELATQLDQPKDVDSCFKKLVNDGAQNIYEPRDEEWGLRSAMIADPEGNLIEIYAFL